MRWSVERGSTSEDETFIIRLSGFDDRGVVGEEDVEGVADGQRQRGCHGHGRHDEQSGRSVVKDRRGKSRVKQK